MTCAGSTHMTSSISSDSRNGASAATSAMKPSISAFAARLDQVDDGRFDAGENLMPARLVRADPLVQVRDEGGLAGAGAAVPTPMQPRTHVQCARRELLLHRSGAPELKQAREARLACRPKRRNLRRAGRADPNRRVMVKAGDAAEAHPERFIIGHRQRVAQGPGNRRTLALRGFHLAVGDQHVQRGNRCRHGAYLSLSNATLLLQIM
jgi:hypothetical protein